jgi:hypothetical protein
VLLLANVPGIPPAALAAGAIWVQVRVPTVPPPPVLYNTHQDPLALSLCSQSESTLAAVQSGWIAATCMRTLNLLGAADPSAGKGASHSHSPSQ